MLPICLGNDYSQIQSTIFNISIPGHAYDTESQLSISTNPPPIENLDVEEIWRKISILTYPRSIWVA